MTLKTTLLAGGVALAALASAMTPALAEEKPTLRLLIEDVAEAGFIESVLPDFKKQTGITVELEKISYPEMHDKLVTQLTSPQSYYNVLAVDYLWAGEFSKADWTIDLKPFAAKTKFDLSTFEPSMMQAFGDQREKVRVIPQYSYTMGFVYRTDILDNPDIKTKYKSSTGKDLTFPANLEEYVELAKWMKKNAGVEGAAMQAQRGDPNSMEFSSYLFATGGRYLDDNGKVVLDSPEARKALKLYADMVQNAAQQGALTANLDDTMRLMCEGKTFSMVTFWYFQPQLDERCPAVKGKMKLTKMPGGVGLTGAWGWSIPKATTPEEQEAAWTFISWIQSPETELRLTMMGHAPTRKEIFLNKDVLAKYPHYKDVQALINTGISFPIFLYSAQYEDVLGTQVSLASAGQASPEQAIAAAAKGLQELMDKAK